MENVSTPTYDSFMNPVIQALKSLGGSGTNEEINNKVIEIMGLSDAQLEIIHDPERSSQTEVEYRLHWSRTYLKKYGLLENSSRGVWALTPKGKETDKVDARAVQQFVRAQARKTKTSQKKDEIEEAEQELSWKEEVLHLPDNATVLDRKRTVRDPFSGRTFEMNLASSPEECDCLDDPDWTCAACEHCPRHCLCLDSRAVQ